LQLLVSKGRNQASLSVDRNITYRRLYKQISDKLEIPVRPLTGFVISQLDSRDGQPIGDLPCSDVRVTLKSRGGGIFLGVRAAESDYVPPTREITQTTARPAPQGPNEARFESDRWARPKQPPTVAAFVPVAAPLPARKLAEREQARAALKKHEQHGGRFSKVYGAQRSRDIEVKRLYNGTAGHVSLIEIPLQPDPENLGLSHHVNHWAFQNKRTGVSSNTAHTTPHAGHKQSARTPPIKQRYDKQARAQQLSPAQPEERLFAVRDSFSVGPPSSDGGKPAAIQPRPQSKAAEAEAALKAAAAEAASERAEAERMAAKAEWEAERKAEREAEKKAAEAERKAAEADAWTEAAKADVAAAQPAPKDEKEAPTEKEARAWFRMQSKQEHESSKQSASGLGRTSTFAQIQQTVTEHSPRSSHGAKGSSSVAVTESDVLDKKPARGGWFKGASSVSVEHTSTVTQVETTSVEQPSSGRQFYTEVEEIQVVEQEVVVDVAFMRRVFRELDTEGAGVLPRLNLRKALDRYSVDLPVVKELANLIRGLDMMVLEEDEFCEIVQEWLTPHEAVVDTVSIDQAFLKNVFDVADSEETGFCPRYDLRKALDSYVVDYPALQSLADTIRSMDCMVIDEDEFEEIAEKWLNDQD